MSTTSRRSWQPNLRASKGALCLFEAFQGLFGCVSEAAVRVHPVDGFEVVAGLLALARGHKGGGAVVVGDAEPGVELYSAVGGLEGGAVVAQNVEARAQGRVVAGEGAAGDEPLVGSGGALVLFAPEEGYRPAFVGRDEADHDGGEDDGAAEVDEQDRYGVLGGRKLHDDRQPQDKGPGREERQQPQEKFPVGPGTQEIPILTTYSEEEDGEDRQDRQGRIEEAHP